MSYEFTIIVPVYNEEDNLARVEEELLAYTKIASKTTKILFVVLNATSFINFRIFLVKL